MHTWNRKVWFAKNCTTILLVFHCHLMAEHQFQKKNQPMNIEWSNRRASFVHCCGHICVRYISIAGSLMIITSVEKINLELLWVKSTVNNTEFLRCTCSLCHILRVNFLKINTFHFWKKFHFGWSLCKWCKN